MKHFGFLLLLCVLLSVARAAITMLLIVLAIALLWGAYFRPRELCGLLVSLAWLKLLHAFPGWCLLALVGLGLVAIISKSSDDEASAPKAIGHTRP